MNDRARIIGTVLLLALLVWSKSGGGVVPPGPMPVSPKATAATYVYEQRGGPVPPAVLAGLNRLNRERGIRATIFDDDTIDGSGQVPAQYIVPLAAAKEAGFPALVVTAGDKVLKVVPKPTTAEEVWGAVE